MVWKKLLSLFQQQKGNPLESHTEAKALAELHAKKALRAIVSRQGANSKIGGLPLADPSQSWPTKNGAPMGFLCQIDLAEAQAALPMDQLPPSGLLSFYYDCYDQPWGFDPKDHGSWSVQYYPPETKLVERDWPEDLGEESRFHEKKIGFEVFESIPSYDRVLHTHDANDEPFWEAYDALIDERISPLQIGGYPMPVQSDDMELECQLAVHGVYCGNPEGYQSELAKELAGGAKDWHLLLQLDSDDDTGMLWGDCGRLYFFVRDRDTINGDFSNAWVILQCT